MLAGKQFRQRVRTLGAKKKRAPWRLAKAILAGRKRLLLWNKAAPPPIVVSPRVRAEMRDAWAGDVDALGLLIGRDLGHWLGRGEAA